MVRLDLDRIRSAASRISPVFLNTPQYNCTPLSEMLGCEVILKVETLNPVRCFKGRGTETVMAGLANGDHSRSVVCASAGNLGQALAYSARSRGISATVIAATTANRLKIERIKALGATVRLIGEDIEAARIIARQIAAEEGSYLVEDSLDLDTCEGAGTMGLELVENLDAFDTVLVGLGGGAMATGIGHVMKCLKPDTEVVTIQPEGAPAMTLSWRVQKVIETESLNTIADGVAGRCPIPEVLDDLLVLADDAMLVSEDSIKAGMRLLYEHAGLIVEPSAALGIAALLENRSRFVGRKVVTIICGSNILVDDFERWVIAH